MSQNSPKEIQVVTPFNKLPVNPEKSALPIQIVGDRVLIDPLEAEEFLSQDAGIARPATMKEDFKKGVIMSIGGGEYGTTIPSSLKVGMTVHYWHQGALDMTFDKKKYHLVRSSDIFMYL
jgi:co-chaperonin GroES (HSP10)